MPASGTDGDANPPQQEFESELANILMLRLCHRAILERIGQELRGRYQPPQDLPHRLLALLVQINEQRGAK